MRMPEPPEYWHWRNPDHGTGCVTYYIVARGGGNGWLLYDPKWKPDDSDHEYNFDGFFTYNGLDGAQLKEWWHHSEECPYAKT